MNAILIKLYSIKICKDYVSKSLTQKKYKKTLNWEK